MIFFSFHIGDWESGTRLLSATEKGIYIDLLTLYYKQEAPIMQMQCKRITRAYSLQEQEAFNYVLETFFTLDGDCYRNNRADEEIAKYHTTIDGRRKAAQTRWNKAKSESAQGQAEARPKQDGCKKDANAYANALQVDMQAGMQKGCKKDAIQYPISNNINNTNKHIPINEDIASESVNVCHSDSLDDDDDRPFDYDPKPEQKPAPEQKAIPNISGMFQKFGQKPNRDPWDDENGQNFDAPIGELIDESNLKGNREAIKNPKHVLTATQLIVLCKTWLVSIGHSARIDEIAKRGTLTVEMAEKVITQFKAKNGTVSTGYLIECLDRASRDPDAYFGNVKKKEVTPETMTDAQCAKFAHALADCGRWRGQYRIPATGKSYAELEAYLRNKLRDPVFWSEKHCKETLQEMGLIFKEN